MDINIKLKSPLAKIPTYATDGSGCFDLYGTNLHSVIVNEGWPVVIGTGLEVEIPKGYGMFILSRSGHGFKFDAEKPAMLDWVVVGGELVCGEMVIWNHDPTRI